MVVANRKLVANLHYMDFKEFSLSMFSDENLARPNVRFSNKSAKREPDEVATKETDVLRAVIALNNYRVSYPLCNVKHYNILIFPRPSAGSYFPGASTPRSSSGPT